MPDEISTDKELTVGPWKVEWDPIGGSGVKAWQIVDTAGHEIAKSSVGPHAFNQANARLIAAAPFLLRTAITLTVMETREDGCVLIGPVGYGQLQEAITEAEGGSI